MSKPGIRLFFFLLKTRPSPRFSWDPRFQEDHGPDELSHPSKWSDYLTKWTLVHTKWTKCFWCERAVTKALFSRAGGRLDHRFYLFWATFKPEILDREHLQLSGTKYPETLEWDCKQTNKENHRWPPMMKGCSPTTALTLQNHHLN